MCSCGNPSPHPVARKTTADGTSVHVWSDGLVTDASIVAGYLPGVGIVARGAALARAFGHRAAITGPIFGPSGEGRR